MNKHFSVLKIIIILSKIFKISFYFTGEKKILNPCKCYMFYLVNFNDFNVLFNLTYFLLLTFKFTALV